MTRVSELPCCDRLGLRLCVTSNLSMLLVACSHARMPTVSSACLPGHATPRHAATTPIYVCRLRASSVVECPRNYLAILHLSTVDRRHILQAVFLVDVLHQSAVIKSKCLALEALQTKSTACRQRRTAVEACCSVYTRYSNSTMQYRSRCTSVAQTESIRPLRCTACVPI